MVRQVIHWSKGLILKNLKDLNEQRADLRDNNAQENYRKLYRAACWHLGSWRKALKEAGIRYRDIEERVYSERGEKEKERLLADLRAAFEEGALLDRGSIIKNPDYRTLYWSAQKFYSGRTFWEDVLTEAGLDPRKIVRQKKWTKERVKEAILKRKAEGKPLNAAALKEDMSLAHAIDNHFGSHQEALRYSGINPDGIIFSRRYTNEQLVEYLQSGHSSGISLNPARIFKDRKRSKRSRERYRFYLAASRRFGDWRAALLFSGINPLQYYTRQKWDEKKVVEEIKRNFESGKPLNSSSVIKGNNSLYKAGSRYYGSWEKAIVAAGLDYSQISQEKESLSEAEIVAKIKELASLGGDLSITSIVEDEDFSIRRLVSQSYNRFDGGWEEAISRAGLDYDAIRKNRRKYKFKELEEAVKEWERNGRSLDVSLVRVDPETKNIYRAAVRRFNSWYGFLERIGVDISKYHARNDWKNGAGVLEALRERFPSGVVTGVRGIDQNLAAAIYAYFPGGIREAAQKAGMVYSRGGGLDRKLLEEQDGSVENLYLSNQQFLQEIVDKVYYGAIGRGIPSGDKDDLMQEAAILFMSLLRKKPSKADLREYVSGPIYRKLIELNKERAKQARKEHLWGEEVYFDLAVSDLAEKEE